MTKIKGLISKERSQYQIFIGLSIVVIVLTGILYFSDNLLFQRFIGGINPLIASFFIVFLGVISLSFLLSKGWFAIYKKENLKGLFRRSSLAALFALITILVVDLKVPFPADMNVLFPESLLFYLAIGFFVEILFHVLPLSILLISLTSIFIYGGETKTCTITNNDKPKAQITVIKKVINNNSGTANASDFTMYVSGDNLWQSFPGSETGTNVTIYEGYYYVGEYGRWDYSQSYAGDCSGFVYGGQTKTCTITNDDI